MFTENIFTATRSNCNITCMKNAVLPGIPNENFTLPAENGTLVSVSATSSASLVDSMFISIVCKVN